MEATENAYSDYSNALMARVIQKGSYKGLPHLSMSWLQGLLCPGQPWQGYLPQCERIVVHHIPMVGACIRKQQRTRKHSQCEHCTPTTPLVTPHSLAV